MDAEHVAGAVGTVVLGIAGAIKGAQTWARKRRAPTEEEALLTEGLAKQRKEIDRLRRENDRLRLALDAERADAAQARQDFLADARAREADVQRLLHELLLRAGANPSSSSEESHGHGS